jgi:putative phage-type endonuclease
MEQRTTEWHDARRGKVTASKVFDVINRTKKGEFYASRETYKNSLIAAIVTGETTVTYESEAMRWGTEKEEEARNEYAKTVFEKVTEVGFIDHPRISGAGASPDGYVGADGLIEIKAPNTTTFIEYILSDKVPDNYIAQMQWQMACTGRLWCDFVAYDPRMPDDIRMFIKRVERDDLYISTMEEMVVAFIKEINETVEKIKNLIKDKKNGASVSK